MSIALIEESAKEIRRLAIAGSPLAVGDFRLKKLMPPLEQAGAKVPVFAQVAKAIGDLVNGTEAQTAERLLALSTLLNAILYTQGQTGAAGDYTGLEALPTNCSSTRTSARALKPLMAALTNAGAGRFEVIKTACEAGAFNDLRLVDPAIRALGDSYSELADLVAEKILPGYGPGIVPRLKIGLDLKGTKQDARKLKLMHRLDPAGTLALCKSALDDGAPEIKAAAVVCLGKHEDCFALVLEQANAKNKTVRAAALEALAEHDRPEIVKLFNELIKGKALDILVRPFRAIRSRQVVNALLAEGRRNFDLVIRGDEEAFARFGEILNCVHQRCQSERSDAEAEQFTLECFQQCESLTKLKMAKGLQHNGEDLILRLAALLQFIGSPRTLEALLAKRGLLPAPAWTMAVRAALRLWPADKVFQEFSPILRENKGVGKEKAEWLQRVIWSCCHRGEEVLFHVSIHYPYDDQESPPVVNWDPRWLGAAIQADEPLLVCCLARPGHQACIDYLLKVVTQTTKVQARRVQLGFLIYALVRCQYTGVTDTFLDLVAKKAKSANHVDYEVQFLFESARHLPAADLPKLDAFAAKLDEKFVDKYLLALEPLRPANQPNQS